MRDFDDYNSERFTRRNKSLRCLFTAEALDELSSLWLDSALLGDVELEFCRRRSFFRSRSALLLLLLLLLLLF